MNKYGKYEPNLSFLNRVPEVKFERINRKELNFDEWSFSVVYWECSISKKWTKCFSYITKEKAKHVFDPVMTGEEHLINTDEEHCQKKMLYIIEELASNWGSSGYDYGVYEVNFRNEVSEDDI